MTVRCPRKSRWLAFVVAALTLCLPARVGAQDPPQESSSKHPPGEGESSSKPPRAPVPEKPAPGQPKFDPLRAEKDVEVGRYYLRKGDLDAAIDRFQDAADSRPGFALPYRLLAETQERKGLTRKAIASYTRYLEIFPHAEDAEKIQHKIQKLRDSLEKKPRKSG